LLAVRSKDRKELEGLPENYEIVHYERSDRKKIDNIAFPVFVRHLRVDLSHIPLNRVALFMPAPYVVTVHDLSSFLFDRREGWRGSARLYKARRGLLRASRVITVSDATLEDVQQLLRVPVSHLRRIYGAPDQRFTNVQSPSEEDRRNVLERYQVNYPFLLYAGSVRPQKNIPRLVEAFALLRGELANHPACADLRLIIIGDEIGRNPQVRRAVIQSRVDKFVRFLGFVPKETLRVFYESAAAFVFPSLYEGFGLPPLEAMCAGTPVVTSNTSSLPEVVGDAALRVSPDNVFDIARGLREVLLDEPLRKTLIERGRARVQLFSWAETARQTLAIYHEAAGIAPPQFPS
jgi:glycosyltransferase involved in cell wall biosynthesis